jgi:hypothetical protein
VLGVGQGEEWNYVLFALPHIQAYTCRYVIRTLSRWVL